MRILVFSDNHFSEKSSIVTKYGTRYTLRLENQLQSLNWVEDVAKQQDCEHIVCLGDFFDHPQLTDQELTALNDIQWSNIPHYFLVGNHESEENDLQYSSTMALSGFSRYVINEPIIRNVGQNVELAFLPYVVESNRKPITEYFPPIKDNLRILFSHNDIIGIQMGPVISRTGFSIDEFSEISHLCVNGHLHNGMPIAPAVMNLGNLTGKDFSEDANKYMHRVLIIDTEKMSCDFIENPYAFNFYKLEVNSVDDLAQFDNLKQNAVLSIKCKDECIQQVRDKLVTLTNIVESRIIAIKDPTESETDDFDIASLCVDQCAKFAECCRAKLGNSDILEAELAEILK